MKWLLPYLSFLLLLSSLAAQSYFPRFHQLEGSLQEAKIEILFECENGLLLLGSDKGLLSYDGLSYTVINVADTFPLSRVTAIAEDGAKNIWVGYANGVIRRMQASTHNLQSWNIEEGWPSVAITGFAFDQLDQLWFATYGEGVYCYKEGHLFNFDEEDDLPSMDIYTIIIDDKGQILVGTDGGVSVITSVGSTKEIKTINTDHGLPDGIIKSLVLDDQGRCWAGTYEGGLAQIDLDQNTVQTPTANWPGGIISCLEVSTDGALWIGTEDMGVLRFNPLSQTYQAAISSGKIYDLLIDQESNLWISDNRNRLVSYNLKFRYLKPGIANIQSVLLDWKEGLWIGTKRGLYYGAPSDSSFVFNAWPVPEWNVISMYEDRAHNIWIGTFGDGLYMLNPGKGKLFHFDEKNGLNNTNILSIYGHDSQIWLGTLGGVYTLDYQAINVKPTDFRFKESRSKQSSLASYVYTLQEDGEGRFWLGTDGDGLSIWENGTVTQFTNYPELVEESIYSLVMDKDGNLFFNSSLGLGRLRNDSLEKFSLPDYIPPNEVSAISVDADNDLIIIHKGGLIERQNSTGILNQYREAVGLVEFSPALNAIEKMGEELIIASDDYLVFFKPDLAAKRYQAKPIISSISASLEEISLDQKKPLAARQNSLAFEITGLWYTDPAKIRYQYRMQGFDQDWISTYDQRIVYSKLPPGDYTFEIAASANGDFSKALIDRFQFKLRAPLLHRPWFVFLLIVFFLSLLYFIIRQREADLKRTAALKRDSVESKYETLKSQINPHFLFNSFNTLVAIIEEEPVHAVTYVEKLTDFYRGILQYRERELIPLSEELRIVADYLFLLKDRYGENLLIQLPDNGEQLSVAPLSLQLLVENAVKHNEISRKKPLTVKIYQAADHYIWVENKLQQKLGNEKSTGLGLQNIKSRYALLSKRPVIIEEGMGLFRVGIPLISISDL